MRRGDAVLHAVEPPARAVADRARRWAPPGRSAGSSTSAAVRMVVAGRDAAGASARAAPALPNSRERQRARARATATPAPARRRDRSARAARQSSIMPEPAAAVLLGDRDAEQVRLRERAPERRGRTTSGSASSAFRRSCVTWSWQMLRASSRSASCSGVKEKSICAVLLARSRHGRGPPIAMMSRCTSLVPPPKVRMSVARYMRSSRPAQDGPGRVALHVAGLSQHLEQQPVGLDVELAAEDLHRRRVGVVQLAAGQAPRLLPVEELQHLAARRSRAPGSCCTQGWSITRRPSGSRVARAQRAPPRRTAASARTGSARRARGSAGRR